MTDLARKLSPGFCRSLPTAVRADNQAATISGLGAVYYREGDPGTEYWLWQDVVERIRPGAFDSQLGADVRSFFNHDPNRILGRTSAGTLKLSLNAEGLLYEVTPPNSEASVVESVTRKDVTGSSFMFIPTRTVWEEIRDAQSVLYIRWIEEVELWEVGPVAFPAYSATTAETQRDAAGATIATRYQQWLTQHVDVARRDWGKEFFDQSARSKIRRRMAQAAEVDLHFRASKQRS